MIKLNPQQKPDKTITHNLFPPEDNYFTQLFTTNYRQFLETNATTDERKRNVARHYDVEKQWKSYLNSSRDDNRANNYYKLLHIMKTLSKCDLVWISFVESLHQHAAIVMCLTCSRFDLEDININQNLLKKKDFSLAGVPHYKTPQMSPVEVFNEILKGSFDAPMLMNPFSVQVLLLAHKQLQIDALMNTLNASSMWISTNKKLSAEKPISKWLADELKTIIEFSKPIQRNKYQQIPEKRFKCQSDVDKNKFEMLCKNRTNKAMHSTLAC
jgi:hypothetical protein